MMGAAQTPSRPMPQALSSAAPIAGMMRSAMSGSAAAHSKLWRAPIDAPITAWSFLMPSESRSAFWTFTKSRIVTIGKLIPYGRPVSELMEAGPGGVGLGALPVGVEGGAGLVAEERA